MNASSPGKKSKNEAPSLASWKKPGKGFLESLPPLKPSVHNWKDPQAENEWRQQHGLPLLPLK